MRHQHWQDGRQQAAFEIHAKPPYPGRQGILRPIFLSKENQRRVMAAKAAGMTHGNAFEQADNLSSINKKPSRITDDY